MTGTTHKCYDGRMFILDTDTIPTSAEELTTAITASLRRSIKLPPGFSPVAITGELPNLDSLTVEVSNGAIDTNQPLPDPNVPGQTEPGPGVKLFAITAHPISIERIPVHFDLSASPGGICVLPQRGGEIGRHPCGCIRRASCRATAACGFGIGNSDGGKKFAASSGVAILGVSASAYIRELQHVDVLLEVTAKKFVTAKVRISGRLSVDADLVATATNLRADAAAWSAPSRLI